MSTPPAGGAEPHLFTPFSVRSVTFRNRVIVSPMCQYAARDGLANDWHRDHHARFALGGIGGALVESTGVRADGRITPACLGLYNDSQAAALRPIVDLYHRAGVPVGIQLSHSGRKGSAATPADGAAPLAAGAPSLAWETCAPSAIAMTEGWPTPHALGADEIEGLVAAFAAAARRALAAGFDFIEIHGAHGYLIHSFMSPLSNRRNDAWGGDLAGRMRFPLAVARAVRAVMPASAPLFYRASAVDAVEGGLEIADTIALARALKAAGVDLIDCSAGGITGASGRAHQAPTPGYLVPYAEEIRGQAAIPVMAVGLIVDPHQAEAIIAEGRADLVALGRQLLADPNFAFHAAEALGVADPFSVLPASYAFFLKRRPKLAPPVGRA